LADNDPRAMVGQVRQALADRAGALIVAPIDVATLAPVIRQFIDQTDVASGAAILEINEGIVSGQIEQLLAHLRKRGSNFRLIGLGEIANRICGISPLFTKSILFKIRPLDNYVPNVISKFHGNLINFKVFQFHKVSFCITIAFYCILLSSIAFSLKVDAFLCAWSNSAEPMV